MNIRNVDDLYNHIGYVVLAAPDRFPVEDYLPPEEQMTLDRAFQLLRDGIEIVYPDDRYIEKKGMLYSLLNESLNAYKAGNRIVGAHILQDFQDNIFAAS